jgi:hypothetical protein
VGKRRKYLRSTMTKTTAQQRTVLALQQYPQKISMPLNVLVEKVHWRKTTTKRYGSGGWEN